ncbi:MAG TPA: formyltetrahydrofolate deformylase [Burkholderiaceae bacterium]|nr:formyltetrahydrofolate deformylase [Burkholderiaceae bacterium]
MTYSTQTADSYTLRVTCPATTGLVAAITGHLAPRKFDITELAQYDDDETRRFFMRCVFTVPPTAQGAVLGEDFAATAAHFSMDWTLRRNDRPYRVLLLVSKVDHCLRDLLYRWETHELNMTLVGIASNHDVLQPVAARSKVAFHYLAADADGSSGREEALRRLIAAESVDLIVLARYMQILSDRFARDFAGRCINIHHSFLPGFKGGSPYAQAHARGVKLIGATAHYVTRDLDEGPIIEQDVRRIDHRHSVPEMQALGRDIEAAVLARALRLHLEDRVFIDGNKTIVFS